MRSLLASLASLSLLGCASDPERDPGRVPLPWAHTEFPLIAAPPENPTTKEKVALGRLLFYDPVFSADREVACATCHSELWGLGDGLPRSIGLDGGRLTGPGRVGTNLTRRNSQTLWNVGYRRPLFWDGRAETLEEQVHFPFESAVEFGRSMDDVAADLRAIAHYVTLFQEAFPDEAEPVTKTTISRAVAAFERTFVSDHAIYDNYVDGDENALSDSWTRGMSLFAESGCVSCHVPPLFESDRFEDRGVPPLTGVDDAGRVEVTGDPADRNRFKVPTLRNVHDTSPYFHTGAVASFDDAVRHEVDFAVSHGESRDLSESEISDLTAFIMKTLFDPGGAPIRPKEVPSGFPVPIDGFDIRR